MNAARLLSSDIRHPSSEKRRGGGGATPPPPRIRAPDPWGGWGRTGSETPGSGDGHEARPPGSLHRRGRRMPAGRPDLVEGMTIIPLFPEHDLFQGQAPN